MRRLIIAAIVTGTLALGACGLPSTRADDPCRPAGCSVPGPRAASVAEYVALCHDVDGEEGPCVDQGVSGAWYYIAEGATFPYGVRLVPCAGPDGGPVPCVWVPSAMGQRPATGDAGAYVYRVLP